MIIRIVNIVISKHTLKGCIWLIGGLGTGRRYNKRGYVDLVEFG